MDVAAWLRGLGLERYEQAFLDNEIDWAALPRLTAEDLKDLGVVLGGHRRKLLDAIATLGASVPAATAPAASRDAPAPADAERRQLTVMFCDLVGSTALSARLDPEDLREVIGAYHRAVAEIVAGFDGFVAKYMGDGVLVYFGYPRAHEDDAERAVRAGLGTIDAVGRLDVKSTKLQVRLGIATGLAVVGDLIGEGAAQERGVVGETPNLAARLQALAAPNTLVIAASTRRQVGGLFELADLGPQALAGFTEPRPAWRVIGESGVLSRFEALRSGTTPLVGRNEELDLLLRRWEQAKTGEGRVVLISGEPGIGKSRLTAALNEHIADEPHTRLRYFCSPHRQDSALYPFIAQLERAAGFARDDGPEAKIQKFAALLGPAAKTGDISLLAELMSLPGGERFSPLNLSPQRKKERTLAALLRQLEGLARQQPVLMIFEDLHWIDPTSRELLDLTIEGIDRLPVLLVATFRPEFQSPWAGRSQVTVIALNRLRRSDGAAMVQRLAANAALADETIAEIVERTDGVPLFVEELTKAVLESAGQGDRVAAVLATTSLAALSVPATLHASLMARLDRLGPAPKEIAQIGAVLGREFTYELIEPVARRPDLDAALGQLTDAGLLFCRGIPPQSSYLFKHALVQDAAYSTLLRGRRQELHGRVAAALGQHFADLVERQPELLAWHLTEAGLTEPAIEYWRRAGERAVEHSANLEAIAHLTRGFELLQTLPESPERDDWELGFHAALMAPHWASKGWGSPGAERAAARAFELCQGAGADTAEHFTALFGLAAFYMVRGQLRVGRELGAQCLALSERLGDETLLGYGHFLMGDFLLWFGELAAARAHLEHGLALWEPERDEVAAARFGFANGVACRTFLGRALWYLGYPEQAARNTDEAMTIAQRVSHPFSQAWALSWAAALRQLRGEVGWVRELADADLALSTEQVIPFFAGHAMVLRGWALVEDGQSEEGVARLVEGIAAYRATGAEIESSYWLALLAEACGKAGQIARGLCTVAEALALTERTDIRHYEAELNRIEGELRLRLDAAEAPRAETCFRRAIDIARVQQAKSLELRAATSLARVWGEQGRRAEARDLLAPVYGWFTEGFDTADLKDAKALLDALA